ncbi:hypothetical protein OROHE_009688 [Orobanche hederae]
MKNSNGSHRVLLLHGNLDIWVNQAKNLPNMDLFHKNLGDMFGKLSGKFLSKIEGSTPSKVTSDPYVTISVSEAVIGRTFVISNTENPIWAQHFHIPVAHYGAEVHFMVKDSDIVGSQIIGSVGIPVQHIYRVQKPRVLIRGGETVTLYQDAHVHDGLYPNLWLASGRLYRPGHCWHDIYDAVSEARKLIYITGWSIYHLVRLVRADHNVKESSLGELLKVKSQEGVRVLLLVWDGPTSTSLLSWVKKQETGTIYTHHQKSVTIDADAGDYRRKIVAFVGGLDFCMGRYDHQIFSTLETVRKYDFHNPNFTGAAVGCPREPWLQKMKASYDDSLLRFERIPDVLGIEEAAREREGDLEGWHVQVLRSIDSNSVKGFPKDPKEAPSRNLVCGKNILIDMSIHTAYVKAIRAAQHFIYIENQYFLGSSYNWANYKDLGANNLLPMEIALKIVSKIRVRERFSVYIVFGLREFQPVLLHRFLFWQTMQMMYETIYKALEEVGLEKEYEPSDYLNFFCLGNREAEGTGSKPDSRSFTGNTPQSGTRKNRHFMIYVQSKGMIVDDEFVILGSANINQRSLEGTRDTEIAMGAYQPHYTWEGKHANPHGQIYRYRMSLWAEHTGI